jgi:hypothetical protein
MERKIRKLTMNGTKNDECIFSSEICKGHFNHHGTNTLRDFEDRIVQLINSSLS